MGNTKQESLPDTQYPLFAAVSVSTVQLHRWFEAVNFYIDTVTELHASQRKATKAKQEL